MKGLSPLASIGRRTLLTLALLTAAGCVAPEAPVETAGSGSLIHLEARSAQESAVALWGAPIVSGDRQTDPPNVIFYVIDGGDANLMSLYEYDRPTTPFLEELAAEGVLFGRAHSNATWTQPSTASFMTSLQHSVLGGLRRGFHSTPVPTAATGSTSRPPTSMNRTNRPRSSPAGS